MLDASVCGGLLFAHSCAGREGGRGVMRCYAPWVRVLRLLAAWAVALGEGWQTLLSRPASGVRFRQAWLASRGGRLVFFFLFWVHAEVSCFEIDVSFEVAVVP